MLTNVRATFLALLLLPGIAGCQITIPELSAKEKDTLSKAETPFSRETLYQDALTSIGELIERLQPTRTIFQAKNIQNHAGGNELPFDVTNMVATAVNRAASGKLLYTPYDPNYIINESNTGGAGRVGRMLPNVVFSGGITEFDKDVESRGSDFNLDIVFGKGGGETDARTELANSDSFSRITLDLHLVDYGTSALIPNVQASNTIIVYKMNRSNDLGFFVYGTGAGASGRIKISQGLHQAVRNLVELSVLEILGKYYDLPYWMHAGRNAVDEKVLESALKSFTRDGTATRVRKIQTLLSMYPLGTIRANNRSYDKVIIDGQYGSVTKAFINRFRNSFHLDKNKTKDLKVVYRELLINFPG